MLGRLGVEKPEDVVIRELLEGTAAHTGPEFFSALVRHLALALDVAGAWVTEFSANRRRLRAFSFWYQDRYIPDYEYSVEGTPCEPVVDRCTLVHVPDNVVELYPRDPDLAPMNAVSYLAMPLVGDDGCVLGHLAVLDIRPLALTARVEALFRIFGARAAAELRRLRSEQRTRDRERQLSSIFDSTWEPILVLDEQDLIREANRAARAKFGLDAAGEAPVAFPSLLPPDPASRWQRGPDARLLSGLELRSAAGSYFPAEVSVAPFQRDGGQYRTLVVRDLQEQREAERRLALLAEELEDLRPVGKLIGECPAMRVLFGQIRKVAATSVTVLIQGETGTGKELVARAIHDSSPRHGKPLVRVNCGAIPAALMESEFFGHEKGAFTGATERREGRFALADGGTLFLDEIGELPPDLQVKLLRVLQEGEFEPVGGARTRRVDVRVIAATNRDLPGEIERGRFRADLYYRLNVFPIQVPPLRSRGSDIDLLAGALVEGLGRRLGRRFRPLSRAALGLLRGYHWPGNVRELENVLERAAILARGEEISLDGVLHTVQASSADAPPSSAATCVLSAAELETFERDNLIRALEVCGWRVAGELGAAKLLGVAPSTFSSRMKALGVARPHDKSSAAVP